MNLTAHFTLEEMISSPTAKRLGFDEQQFPPTDVMESLMDLCENVLEPLRVIIKHPIVVSSGYRCRRLNRAVSGAKKSQHCLGQAADISEFVEGNENLFKKIIALKIPFDCLINEFNYDWVHISFNKDKNRGVILESYFEDGKVKYKNP